MFGHVLGNRTSTCVVGVPGEHTGQFRSAALAISAPLANWDGRVGESLAAVPALVSNGQNIGVLDACA